MNNNKHIYWYCQIIGWAFYVSINMFFFKLSYNTNFKDILLFTCWFPLGILITHFYRQLLLKYKILNLNLHIQVPITLLASLIMSILFFIFNIGIAKILDHSYNEINLIAASSKILSVFLIFMIWSIIYFGFHFFDNYKKTEIQKLKLEANTKEVELQKLKSQLNPHFIFNSMNSIRALIDENPQKAKLAITQLSNILRNTLMMDKNKFITLEEELVLVKDYLELEHIRFEERLNYYFDVDPKTLLLNIPPMMIQTLVENGIKHGISKNYQGGVITIITMKNENYLDIEIINTGQLPFELNSNSGIGIKNTTNRLNLLYNNSKFSIKNLDNQNVISKITIYN